MIRHLHAWTWLLLMMVLAAAPPALAQNVDPPARFGNAPANGQDASATIAVRDATLRTAMACGNELAFARGYSLASRFGKESSDLAQWPVTLLIGKAAWLVAAPAYVAPALPAQPAPAVGPASGAFLLKRFSLDPAGTPQPPNLQLCRSRLTATPTADGPGDLAAEWGNLTRSGPVAGEAPAAAVNRAYAELYDATAGAGQAACGDVAHPDGDGVIVELSLGCLARQIRAVMNDPRHGPWTEEGGQRVPQFPGTSADKLPCLSELKTKLKGLKGDWDMGVIEYTRLAGSLYRYDRGFGPIGDDIETSLDALNRRFLTLRSSPEQGATAREGFNLLTSCGNLPNQFGDAADTVSGTGADPGADRYSDAAKKAVGDSSFWKSLLRFLAALLLIVVVAVAAVVVGIVVGLVAGIVAAVTALVAVAVVATTLLTSSLQETENHLLMQNSSRYIKNKLMMAELSDRRDRAGFDTIADLNEELREWLLKRLQRIAEDDFVEYNSKPYNRLSHAAILNLLDYACDVPWGYDDARFILSANKRCDPKDRALVDAASAVLDLSAAKDAVGSYEGRRLIPYRRLAEQNAQFAGDRSLLELVAGADAQLGALQIWTGQMRHAPNGEAAPGTFNTLMWFGTSRYRPDPLILQIAIDKTVPREQQYRHHTRERYVSGNGWLITAGGSDEGPAQGLRLPFGVTVYPTINEDVVNDRGVGVPTTLMTSALIAGADGKPTGRSHVRDFLRFEGAKKDWGLNGDKPMWSYSDNNCVAGSFACGLAMQMPSDFDPARCHVRVLARGFFIVDSKRCPSFDDGDDLPGNDLFIAIYRSVQGWGFWEVAQQDAFGHSIEAFAAAIMAKNAGAIAGWDSAKPSKTIHYFAVTQNTQLDFTPADEDFGADRRACGVVNHESGARFTISDVPAAQAGQCRSVGPRIFIDLNDAMKPIRRGEGGLALESFVR